MIKIWANETMMLSMKIFQKRKRKDVTPYRERSKPKSLVTECLHQSGISQKEYVVLKKIFLNGARTKNSGKNEK